MEAYDNFQVARETEIDHLRLVLKGELDLASRIVLTEELKTACAAHQRVVLDLSQLEFIDSTGLQTIILGYHQARSDGWELRIDPNLAPQVKRLFELAGVTGYLIRGKGPSNTDQAAPPAGYATDRSNENQGSRQPDDVGRQA